MRSEKLLINGMSCHHCVMAVKKELSKLDIKINDVQIGLADIEYDDTKVTREKVEAAIKEAGYELKS